MLIMKTQIRLLGTIDLVLGLCLFWPLRSLWSESTMDFVQKEFTLTVFLVGLIVGGVGLWVEKKIGWIANQMTGIHIVLSAIVGMIIPSNRAAMGIELTTTFILLTAISLIVLARLLWTNTRQWIQEFDLSNKLRFITITFGTIVSLILLLKSYV